jgi:hypothetical protein
MFSKPLESHHAECTKPPISFACSYTSTTPSLTIKGTDSLKQQKCATSYQLAMTRGDAKFLEIFVLPLEQHAASDILSHHRIGIHTAFQNHAAISILKKEK